MEVCVHALEHLRGSGRWRGTPALRHTHTSPPWLRVLTRSPRSGDLHKPCTPYWRASPVSSLRLPAAVAPSPLHRCCGPRLCPTPPLAPLSAAPSPSPTCRPPLPRLAAPQPAVTNAAHCCRTATPPPTVAALSRFLFNPPLPRAGAAHHSPPPQCHRGRAPAAPPSPADPPLRRGRP